MEKKLITIHNVDDFGLAITASTRMYRRTQDLEILTALQVTFDTLMPYIDNRTLICAIRDFQPDSVETWGRGSDDSCEPKEFFALREKLMITYTNRELGRLKGRITDYSVVYIGRDMESIADGNHKGCFASPEEFLEWAKKNCKADEKYEWKDYNNGIAIEENYFHHFRLLCLNMVQYSWRRHTYMPDTAASFVKTNISLLDEKTAKEIIEASENDPENVCWIDMRNKLKGKFEFAYV